jgi:hypothetical protein
VTATTSSKATAETIWFSGGPGDDMLEGNGANDILWGEEGNDTLEGDEGADQLHGGDDDDDLEGNEGDDWLDGDEGEDILDGGDDDDVLDGGAGDDIVINSFGDDYLVPGEGFDLESSEQPPPPVRDASCGPAYPVLMGAGGYLAAYKIGIDEPGHMYEGEEAWFEVQRVHWLPWPDLDLHLQVELIDDTALLGLDYAGPQSFVVELPGGQEWTSFSISTLSDDLVPPFEEGVEEKFYIRYTILELPQCVSWRSEITIYDSTIRAEDDAQLVNTLDPTIIQVLPNDHPGYRLEVADYTEPEHGELEPLYDDGKLIAFRYTRDPQYLFTDEYFTYTAKRGNQVSNEAFVYLQAADPPPPMRVSIVDFHNNLLLRSDPRIAFGDITWTNYAMPAEYYDWNADGQITAPRDHAFPIAYMRGSTISLSGILKAVGPSIISSQASIRVKASGDINMEVSGFIRDDGRSVSFGGQSDAPLPFQVNVDPDFKIFWDISFDGGATWQDAGSSTQKLYRTFDDSITTNLYETVVWVGSYFGAGATTEAELFSSVWAHFQGRGVKRLDSTNLKYWFAGEATPAVFKTAELLVYTDGRCDSWVDLFRDVLGAQGLESARKLIVPKPIGSLTPIYIYINNWNFPAHQQLLSSQLPQIPAGYAAWRKEHVTSLDGLGAQNTPNPWDYFDNHVIVEYNGKYYDPSYGAGPYNPDFQLNDWENAALAGVLVTTTIVDPITGNVSTEQVVVKNKTSWADTIIGN